MLPRLPLDRTLLERLLKLDARFVDELGRITRDFLRESGTTLGESLREHEAYVSRPIEPPSPSPSPTGMPLYQPAKPPGGTIVLEEEAGKIAYDVFLVQNNLKHRINVRPEVSQFLDPPAPGLGPNVSFDPKEVKLPPQMEVMIRIMAFIDPNLQSDVLYKCELTVPALGDAKTPVVIRRRIAAARAAEQSPQPPYQTQ
jgi:hypothetical protein